MLRTTLPAYFRSGWAFLIPYLAAYLLYAWLRWPVNPVAAGSSPVDSDLWPVIPRLLHVYWALHAVHLVLGTIALCIWWRESALKLQLSTSTRAVGDSASCLQSPASAVLHRLLSTGYRLLPWVFLALLFLIPGLYLEWPSDPWDHLRRINEWHILDQVTAHSSWKKSSYFLPYSVTGHTTGLDQLSLLNIYNTGVCLLLSWQYYLLARAIGLSERLSFVFILLNALTLGNNIFSFYRYYGLSSSIFAQLGAVALTRIALDAVSTSKFLPLDPRIQSYSLPTLRCSLMQLVAATATLLLLIALNHIQGIGIVGIGILAVIIWRLLEWKRNLITWAVAAAVVLSIAVVAWFPRHPVLDEVYRPQGWLTTWYGFNFFSPTSPTFVRAWHILGFFGVINSLIGLWLIVSRNHIAGWLTLMPVIALTLPCFALPFAHVVAANTSTQNILTFHRMLLAIPMGLAVAAVLSRIWPVSSSMAQVVYGTSSSISALPEGKLSYTDGPSSATWTEQPLPPARFRWKPSFAFLFKTLPLALLLALVIAPGSSGYNRFWHTMLNTADDLRLLQHMPDRKSVFTSNGASDTLLIEAPLRHEIQQVFFLTNAATWERLRLGEIHSFNESLDNRLKELEAVGHHFSPHHLDAHAIQSDGFSVTRLTAAPKQIATTALVADSSWIAFGSPPPEYTSVNGRLVVSNQAGSDSVAFNGELIPISRYRRYHLTCAIRQTGSPTATNFLAVAWYDQNKRLLPSRERQPQGAGAPRGWNNSTYSYYGLIDQPGGDSWTHYSISFGLGETASIPANASFLRFGAILNYRAISEAKVELADAQLIEKPLQSRLMIIAPGFWHLHTPASQAGILSEHWTAQSVPLAHAGTHELRITAFLPSD